ncbi:MAG: hypothetical protein R8K49_09285 [Mariprofundaceae bacterium]
MLTVFKDKALLYHHLEWMLAHPRFGIFMLALIGLSFTHNRVLAAILFVFFAFEIAARATIMIRKAKVVPYRSSLNQKVDQLLLALDVIGVASLLVTVFQVDLGAENVAAIRLLRGAYLLRTLRIFRYIDLQSAMYSPTYGMFISLVILISFFATDTLLWIVIIFFFVELSMRFLIMRNMIYESSKEKNSEWLFWWLDLVATIAMTPFFTFIPYGAALRMLRLIRLFRPWMIIIRNLRDVLRDGQFMQEINLIVLILAVFSIGGGVMAHLGLKGFDFSNDGMVNSIDGDMFAPIWFAFRMLTDPGNTVFYPDSIGIAIFSITAVILGVFVFAFFIGIGANIVSGLMRKLRNERLIITNHMVMLGWSSAAPYIIRQLKTIAEHSFTKLKLVLLHHDTTVPPEVLNEKWMTYRHGSFEHLEDLRRVNISAARQGLILMPPANSAKSLSHAFFSLLAIRRVNPNISLSFAIPGMADPHLDSHKHMLQVGWDKSGRYEKPTTVLSEADFRANAFCNIMRYSDFDQVISRLLIPEKSEESSLHISEWQGRMHRDEESGAWLLEAERYQKSAPITELARALFEKGVTLLSLVDESGEIYPIYSLDEVFKPELTITSILGICINESALYGETMGCIRYQGWKNVALPKHDLDDLGLHTIEPSSTLKLLVIGWVGSLPLLLKRLLLFYHELELIILDDLPPNEIQDQHDYLKRRLAEEPGLDELVNIRCESWDFSNMNALREFTQCDRIILSRPLHMEEDAYAVVATTLSHLMTIVEEEEIKPKIFPVLEDREQVMLLQQELAQDELYTEVHMTVPNEFYGVYVAHTTFHMFTAENKETHQTKRVLRHAMNQLMIDFGDNDKMDLKTMHVEKELPDDLNQLFADLLNEGQLLIGYRLKKPFHWKDPVQSFVHTIFPKEHMFADSRQHELIINPYGNPVSYRSWIDCKKDIVELIVITSDNEDELF